MKVVQINLVQDSIEVTTNTFSPAVQVSGVGPLTVAIQISVTGVSNPSGATIQLQGSLDGTNFFNIGSTQSVTAAPSEFVLTDTAPAYGWYRSALVRSGGSFTVTPRVFVYGDTL
jgi:hypothetical protein